MKVKIIFISLLFCFSCTEKDKGVNASNTIIDSLVSVTAELRMKGVEIYYTVDGIDPSLSSQKYKSTLDIKRAGIYKFRAFHSNWKSSEVSELKLYKKGISPIKINWQTNASNSYPGLGESTLINNKKGALNFRDKEWIGFDTIARAQVDFDKNIFIKRLTIGYLIDTKSWIFPPESVSVIINEKDTICIKVPKLKNTELLALNDVSIPIEKKAESIKIIVNNTKELPEWHSGKGLKAWLFMDEWIFN